MRPPAVLAAALVVLLGLGACGDDPAPQEVTSARPEVTGLDAHVVEATVVGPAAEVLRVEPLPAGLLLPEEPVLGLLDFVASEPVELGELVRHTTTARAEEGGGVLGISGFCGLGWEPDGRRRTEDRCAAAEPVSSVSPGRPLAIGLRLHARTDQGTAAPGRYPVIVPLAEGSSLRVVYELTAHEERTVEWSDPVAELRVVREEIAPPRTPELELRVEDVFRTPYETTPFPGPGPVALRLPAGVWRVLASTPGAPPCGFTQVVVRPGEDVETALILHVDADGRCPAASASAEEPGELVAAFTFDFDRRVTGPTSCPVVAVRFTDTSEGDPVAWRWTFPDGDVVTEQHTVRPGDGGEEAVTLTVEDAAGHRSSVTQVVRNGLQC